MRKPRPGVSQMSGMAQDRRASKFRGRLFSRLNISGSFTFISMPFLSQTHLSQESYTIFLRWHPHNCSHCIRIGQNGRIWPSNLHRFPKGNILSSEKSCQAPGTWLVRNQASWWSTWQNKTPGDSQVMKTRTSWMCPTTCMYCKWKRFCSTVRVISHASKSFSFFSFIFQLKV